MSREDFPHGASGHSLPCRDGIPGRLADEAATRRRSAVQKSLSVVNAMAFVVAGAILVGVALWAYMRRFSLISALVASGLLAGCGADPKKVADLDAEIATLTSAAIMPGPRTPFESKKFTQDGATARQHLHELTGK